MYGAMLGTDTLSEGNKVAVEIENPKLARAPWLVLERRIRVNYALWREFTEQLVDTRNVHPTTRVFRDIAIRARPKMNLHVVARDDTPTTRFNIDANETQARAVESHRALDIEGCQDGCDALQA